MKNIKIKKTPAGHARVGRLAPLGLLACRPCLAKHPQLGWLWIPRGMGRQRPVRPKPWPAPAERVRLPHASRERRGNRSRAAPRRRRPRVLLRRAPPLAGWPRAGSESRARRPLSSPFARSCSAQKEGRKRKRQNELRGVKRKLLPQITIIRNKT